MTFLLSVSRFIDAVNERIGRATHWLVLICVLVSAGNAMFRYTFNLSSNAFLEVQWYLFGLVFLLAAPYTLKHNGHVRIDLISHRLSPRAQAWIDVFGGVFMLLPVCLIITYYSWGIFLSSYHVNEGSPDPGGLLRWPIKLVAPVAFLLLSLQGLSETIKRIAFLKGLAGNQQERFEAVE